MKRFRVVVGLLGLVALIAIGAQACVAAEASIEGRTSTQDGSAAFTTGLFLCAGFGLAALVALMGRKSHVAGIVAAVPLAAANLFVGGGNGASPAFVPWVWLGWALAAAMALGGLFAIAGKKKESRIGLPPGTGRPR